MSAEDSLGR